MSKRDELNRLLDRELEKGRREIEWHGKASSRRVKAINALTVEIAMEAWRETMAKRQWVASVLAKGEQAHG